ncbi:hypothetical protein [Rhodoferax sp.]|nr:hypothetical protein [Rhodoferax sp.]MDP1943539.1 hypothetical protein [Rhodoferax sp.]
MACALFGIDANAAMQVVAIGFVMRRRHAAVLHISPDIKKPQVNQSLGV